MKYRLTDETKEWNGHTLHKIEYTAEWLKEHGLNKLEGGWIESEKNLSQGGNARVCGNAWVYGEAWVYGDAWVAQGRTTSMRITTTDQWYEYQYRKAELQKKWDKESEGRKE